MKNLITVNKLASTPGMWERKDVIPKGAFYEVVLPTDNFGILDSSNENVSRQVLKIAMNIAIRHFILGDELYLNDLIAGAKNMDKAYSIGIVRESEEDVGTRLLQYALFLLQGSAQKDIDSLNDDDFNGLAGATFLTLFRDNPIVDVNLEPHDFNDVTKQHLKIMLKRCKSFFDTEGLPIASNYIVLNKNKNVYNEGDFLGEDYVVDVRYGKKNQIDIPKERRKILINYILGCDEKQYADFQNTQALVLFSPRTNQAFEVKIEDIPTDLIERTRIIAQNYKNSQ